MSQNIRNNNEHPNKIRNGRIRRDFKRLLSIIAESPQIHEGEDTEFEIFAEVEEIAKSHALEFDDDGAVIEIEREGE